MGPSAPRLAPPAVPRARATTLVAHAPRVALRRRSKTASAATVAAAAVVAAAVAVAQPTARPADCPSASPMSPAVADALAGGLACGAMDVLFVADVLKVRAQSGTPLLRGGARALFAGAVPSALFRVAHGVLYLPIYAAAKRCLHHDAALPEPLAVASAAAVAVTATALVELPLEALLLRVKTGGSASFAAAARSALASPAGLAGLWAGAAPYVLRHVIYEAAEFVVYEHLRSRELRRRAGADAAGGLDARTAARLAAAAGAAATLLSHPLDCVRVAGSLGAGGSARAVAAHIMRTAGPAGFARGLAPRLASTVPGAAIFFTVWEAARSRLGPPEHSIAPCHADAAVEDAALPDATPLALAGDVS